MGFLSMAFLKFLLPPHPKNNRMTSRMGWSRLISRTPRVEKWGVLELSSCNLSLARLHPTSIPPQSENCTKLVGEFPISRMQFWSCTIFQMARGCGQVISMKPAQRLSLKVETTVPNVRTGRLLMLWNTVKPNKVTIGFEIEKQSHPAEPPSHAKTMVFHSKGLAKVRVSAKKYSELQPLQDFIQRVFEFKTSEEFTTPDNVSSFSETCFVNQCLQSDFWTTLLTQQKQNIKTTSSILRKQ